MQQIIRHILIIIIYLSTSVFGDTFCADKTGMFYPYPPDCTKFYECNSGNTVIRNCGPGTKWIQDISGCGWECGQPENGGGGGTDEETTTESQAEAITTTTKSQTTTTEPQTTTSEAGTTEPHSITEEAIATTTELQTTTTETIETTRLQTTTEEAIETTTELQTTTTEAIETTTELQTTTSAPIDVPIWACSKKNMVPNEDQELDCEVIAEITLITRIHCLNKCVVSNNCTCVNFKKDVLSSSCFLLHCAGQTYTVTPSPNTVAICL